MTETATPAPKAAIDAGSCVVAHEGATADLHRVPGVFYIGTEEPGRRDRVLTACGTQIIPGIIYRPIYWGYALNAPTGQGTPRTCESCTAASRRR